MKLLKFIKYVSMDIYANYKLRREGLKPFKEYGLRLYSGVQGSGKTMSMVHQLEIYREEFPGLLIATNFGYINEDLPLTSLSEIPSVSKLARENGYIGVVIGWDEIQNDFDNQTRSFPISILRTITQQRKQAIKILATSQVFTRVAKPIREQTFEVVQCSTILNRWTFERFYDPVEFEYFIQNPDKKEKMNTKRKINFIQTNEMRELYDSYAVIDSLDQLGKDNLTIEQIFQQMLEKAEQIRYQASIESELEPNN